MTVGPSVESTGTRVPRFADLEKNGGVLHCHKCTRMSRRYRCPYGTPLIGTHAPNVKPERRVESHRPRQAVTTLPTVSQGFMYRSVPRYDRPHFGRESDVTRVLAFADQTRETALRPILTAPVRKCDLDQYLTVVNGCRMEVKSFAKCRAYVARRIFSTLTNRPSSRTNRTNARIA